MLVLMGFTMMVSAPIMMVGAIVMAMREDVGLSWLIVVTVPVLAGLIGFIVSRMVPSFRVMQEKIDEVNRLLREQITGIRVVRAFVREEHETRAVQPGQRGPDRRSRSGPVAGWPGCSRWSCSWPTSPRWQCCGSAGTGSSRARWRSAR